MANPNPKPGKLFVKGQVANPLGAGAHNKEVKALRRLTHKNIAEIGSLIMDGNLEKLKEVRSNPKTSVLKVWMCSVAIAAINKGDAQALNAFLDRVVGKPKETVDLNATVNSGFTAEEMKLMRERRAKIAAKY